MGWLCVFEPTRRWGVRFVLLFHSYIISQTPIASVFEWNIYSMLMTYYLFGGEAPLEWPKRVSPILRSFLLTAILIVPTIGQLCPSRVPFLMAYRPYAGNWRAMWFVMSKAAVSKLRRLKTFASPLPGENAMALVGSEPRYEEHFDYIANASGMCFPGYRPLPSIVEALMEKEGWGADDMCWPTSHSRIMRLAGRCMLVGVFFAIHSVAHSRMYVDSEEAKLSSCNSNLWGCLRGNCTGVLSMSAAVV